VHYRKWFKSTTKNIYRVLGLGICLPFIILWLSFDALAAEQVKVDWIKDYSRAGTQEIYALAPAEDGGIVLAGSTRESGKNGMYLLKTDSAGNKQWEKVYQPGEDDRINAVIPCRDGGYLLAGYSKTWGDGDKDIYYLRIDKSGETIWESRQGGDGDDEIYAILQDPKGGYLLAGYTETDAHGNRDAYLLRLEKDGAVRWESQFGESVYDEVFDLACCPDGGYILIGVTYSAVNRNNEMVLFKSDAQGQQEWVKSYGADGWQTGCCIMIIDEGGDYLVEQGGNYLVLGEKKEDYATGGKKMGLMFLNKDGEKIWERTYGENLVVAPQELQMIRDGHGYGYLLMGNIQDSRSQVSETYLVRTNEMGNLLWQERLLKQVPDYSPKFLLVDNRLLVAGQKRAAAVANQYNASLAQISFLKSDVEQIKDQEEQHGIIQWPDQSRFEGGIQNGKASGWGRMLFPDGTVYEGEWLNNMFHGQGTIVFPSNEKYQGEFRHNLFHGYGVFTWPTGEKYEGEFRYNQKSGQGVFTWPGGIEYRGEFYQDQAHGYGEIIWKSGTVIKERYKGQMSNGQPSGLGSYYFANGDYYTGNFSNLTFSGIGTYYYANGASYFGEFQDDKFHGQGVYTWPNGVQQWGYWENDRYIGLTR
jgi:hypothetical protein